MSHADDSARARAVAGADGAGVPARGNSGAHAAPQQSASAASLAATLAERASSHRFRMPSLAPILSPRSRAGAAASAFASAAAGAREAPSASGADASAPTEGAAGSAAERAPVVMLAPPSSPTTDRAQSPEDTLLMSPTAQLRAAEALLAGASSPLGISVDSGSVVDVDADARLGHTELDLDMYPDISAPSALTPSIMGRPRVDQSDAQHNDTPPPPPAPRSAPALSGDAAATAAATLEDARAASSSAIARPPLAPASAQVPRVPTAEYFEAVRRRAAAAGLALDSRASLFSAITDVDVDDLHTAGSEATMRDESVLVGGEQLSRELAAQCESVTDELRALAEHTRRARAMWDVAVAGETSRSVERLASRSPHAGALESLARASVTTDGGAASGAALAAADGEQRDEFDVRVRGAASAAVRALGAGAELELLVRRCGALLRARSTAARHAQELRAAAAAARLRLTSTSTSDAVSASDGAAAAAAFASSTAATAHAFAIEVLDELGSALIGERRQAAQHAEEARAREEALHAENAALQAHVDDLEHRLRSARGGPSDDNSGAAEPVQVTPESPATPSSSVQLAASARRAGTGAAFALGRQQVARIEERVGELEHEWLTAPDVHDPLEQRLALAHVALEEVDATERRLRRLKQALCSFASVPVVGQAAPDAPRGLAAQHAGQPSIGSPLRIVAPGGIAALVAADARMASTYPALRDGLSTFAPAEDEQVLDDATPDVLRGVTTTMPVQSRALWAHEPLSEERALELLHGMFDQPAPRPGKRPPSAGRRAPARSSSASRPRSAQPTLRFVPLTVRPSGSSAGVASSRAAPSRRSPLDAAHVPAPSAAALTANLAALGSLGVPYGATGRAHLSSAPMRALAAPIPSLSHLVHGGGASGSPPRRPQSAGSPSNQPRGSPALLYQHELIAYQRDRQRQRALR